MFLDAGGEKSRAYPTSTSCVLNQETGEEYPCIWYMVEEEDDTYTIIEFPELIGWRVFSVGGGKSCAITLIKGELFE
jgi:hypothetical protein